MYSELKPSPAISKPYTKKPITDIFTNDTSINRRQCRRLVPMKVLILGLGRTGTSSMREAMRQLGYVDTYHMMSASIENPPDALLWLDAFNSKYGHGPAFTRADWDHLLGHCQAVCDWPAIAFAPELMAAYPEAKIILTNRDVDSWYTSTLATVNWRFNDWELRWLCKLGSWGAGMYYPMLKRFFDEFFGGDFEANGKSRFIEHYEEVRRLGRESGREVLEFQVKEGWESLCGFLGEEVPRGVKFPHVNDNSDFVKRSGGCISRLGFLVVEADDRNWTGSGERLGLCSGSNGSHHARMQKGDFSVVKGGAAVEMETLPELLWFQYSLQSTENRAPIPAECHERGFVRGFRAAKSRNREADRLRTSSSRIWGFLVTVPFRPTACRTFFVVLKAPKRFEVGEECKGRPEMRVMGLLPEDVHPSCVVGGLRSLTDAGFYFSVLDPSRRMASPVSERMLTAHPVQDNSSIFLGLCTATSFPNIH